MVTRTRLQSKWTEIFKKKDIEKRPRKDFGKVPYIRWGEVLGQSACGHLDLGGSACRARRKWVSAADAVACYHGSPTDSKKAEHPHHATRCHSLMWTAGGSGVLRLCAVSPFARWWLWFRLQGQAERSPGSGLSHWKEMLHYNVSVVRLATQFSRYSARLACRRPRAQLTAAHKHGMVQHWQSRAW